MSSESLVDPLHTIGEFAQDLVVQAGAGTGKTHALVTLYLHLVTGLGARDEAVPPARILVITFTDKAAGELRERIRSRLGALLEQGLVVEPALEAAAARTGRAAPTPALLRRALTELGRAPIGTFHGFGRAFLARHALAVGLSPGFTLLDETEAQARAIEAARAVVIEALDARDPGTEVLCDELGFHPRSQSGLVEALARLRAIRADEGRDASGIAAGYTDLAIATALRDSRARIRAALAAFAGVRDRVGDKSRARIEILASAATSPMWDDERASALLDELRPEASLVRGNRGDDALVGELRKAFTAAALALDEAEAGRVVAPMARTFERLLGTCEQRYAAWKRAHAVVDFADLISLPRDLLRDDAEVARSEGARVAALLVDEFQDTNRAQAELVERLAAAAVAPTGTGRRFVVGDRKQSIYEFRGADVGIFTEVTEALRTAGAVEVVLRRSFRSAAQVVTLSNALFARAFGTETNQSSWALSWREARDALSATRVDVHDAGAELLGVKAEPEAADDAATLRRLEARAIARRMRALLDAGRRPRDIALLLRRYTHLEAYLEALRRAQLPHYVVRGRGFYEAQEIRDLASLIALLHDPDDRFALVSVLRSPLCGLSDPGLAALGLAEALTSRLLAEPPSIELGAGDARALDGLVERLRGLRDVMDRLGPAALLREVLDRFDLRAIWAGTDEGLQRIANLEHLIARADELAGDPSGPGSDLPRFARWLERAVRPLDSLRASGAQIVDERDDVVRVMTVHQAKGLEFPVVFVADCGAREQNRSGPVLYDATLGIGMKRADAKKRSAIHTTASRRIAELRTERQRAESLRLFYVAATRARDRVVFSGEAFDPKGGWRGHVDAIVGHPDTAALVTIPEPSISNVAPPPPATHEVDVASLPAFLPKLPSVARGLRVAVTQLQDFALCARRYQFVHELRLDEHPRGERESEDDERAASDPLRSGTLAHRLLERCRFDLDEDRSRRELDAQLVEEGYSLDDSEIKTLRDGVLGFLRTSFARSLGARPLRRELPFALQLGAKGHTRVLRGQIDLLAFSSEGIDIVDYKLARRTDLDRYRFQLEAYAMAARALYPRAPRLRVGLVFLRDADPSPAWSTLDGMEAIEARLSSLCEALAVAKTSLGRPGVERARCETIRCGYIGACHREAAR